MAMKSIGDGDDDDDELIRGDNGLCKRVERSYDTDFVAEINKKSVTKFSSQ
jgi:hypothetical protein